MCLWGLDHDGICALGHALLAGFVGQKKEDVGEYVLERGA